MAQPYQKLDFALEAFRGVNLTSAIDQLRPGEFTLAQNASSNIIGQLSTRAGSDRIGPATGQSSPVHSVFYLSDPVSTSPATLTLWVIGAGTTLYGYTGSGSWFTLASGFSGQPLTGVIYRLSGTGQPWLIIGDSAKMVKVAYYGGQWAVFQLGITPPSSVASVTVLPNQLTLQIDTLTGVFPPNYVLANTTTPSPGGIGANPSTIVRSGNVVTFTSLISGVINAGQLGQVSAISDPSFDGTFQITAVTVPGPPATFTYAQIGANASVGVGGQILTGIGFEANASATATMSVPLSINLAEINGNASTTNDSIYFGAYIDNIANATDVQILFDIDPTSVSGGSLTGTAFTKNYYQGSVYSQMASGWNFVSLQKSAFTRIGQGTYDWSGVVAYQFKVIATAGQQPIFYGNNLYLQGASYPNSSVGVGYDWRYTFYNSTTKSESNPSPIMAVDAYPVNQPVELVPGNYSADPQVNTVRWYRRGGTLSSNWYLLGTQPDAPPVAITGVSMNSAGTIATYTTNANHLLQQDNSALVVGVANAAFNGLFEVMTVGSPTTFTVQNLVAGASASSSGGTVQAVFVDAQSDLEIAAAPVLSLQNDVPVTTVSVNGTIIYAQPLQYIWGPFGGVELFGDGDPNQPGNLYWCNSSNPDAWGNLNFVEVTQPSDPLTLGTYWQGNSWARSMESVYQVLPSQLPGFYTITDIGSGESLASPWANIGGSSIPFQAWVGKSGVFIGTGGQGQSITDDKLWPVFNPQLTYGYCIDWTKQQYIRLAYFDHHLRLTYMGRDGTLRTWLFNTVRNYWIGPTVWGFGGTYEFNQPEVTETLLVGGQDGNLYKLDFNATTDNGTAIPVTVTTGQYIPAGFENIEEFGHLSVDAAAPVGGIAVSAYFGGSASPTSIGTCSATSRATTPLSLQNIYARGLQLNFQWTGTGTLFGWNILWRDDGIGIYQCETPPDSVQLQEFGHVYRAVVSLRSTSVVNCIISVDNVALPAVPIASTGGQKTATEIYFPLNKGRLFQLQLISATAGVPFRIYGSDCSLEVQPWNALQPEMKQIQFVGGGPG